MAEVKKVVTNCDNEDLMPFGGNGLIVGHVDEVNGHGAEEITDFHPTRHELIVLVKYWAKLMLEDEYFFFLYEGTGSAEIRQHAFAARRINRIQVLLGVEDVTKAIEEVHEEYKKKNGIDPEEWRIFTSGDEAEWERVREGVRRLADQLGENPPDLQSAPVRS